MLKQDWHAVTAQVPNQVVSIQLVASSGMLKVALGDKGVHMQQVEGQAEAEQYQEERQC